jgi:cytochrome bd-type quinol oxidase subunit 2
MSAAWYHFFVLLHIVGVVSFMTCHGGSMFVLYRIRQSTDREKILDLLTFSGETVIPMYISLAVLVVAGVIAGIGGSWFHFWWIWAAIGVLLLTTGLMTVTARPYFQRVKAACAIRPTGVPRASDEELAELVGGPTANLITAIGTVGLLVILYLMIYKPGL